MIKKIRSAVVVGMMLANLTCLAAPIVGEAVGNAVARATTREVAETVAKQTVKEGATKAMSSALAGVTAKQAMGAGVGVGLAVALPVAAHEIADGYQEVKKAQAGAIRDAGAAAAQSIKDHPETASTVVKTVTNSGSVIDQAERMVGAILPWGAGALGVICCLYLLGFGLKSVAYLRRGLAEARMMVGTGLRAGRSSEETGRPVVAPYPSGHQS